MKTMKFISLMLFTALCCSLCAHEDMPSVSVGDRANCHVADNKEMFNPCQERIEKRYVDPSNVRFAQKEMYVQLDQDWVVTNAVYTDSTGFYILEAKGGWTCGYCTFYNEGNGWTCDNCGRKRD